jgi:hypothetical protein
VFGIKVRAHGPAGGATPPGSQYAPGTDIGPALLPIPAQAGSAWQSRGQVHGAPGTQRVPAPAPFPGYDVSPVAQASTGFIGIPSSAVQFWYPQIWYQNPAQSPALAPPVNYLNSTHEIPVPAIRPNQVMAVRAVNSPGGITPAGGAFAARMGGRWPIGWPRVVVNYPENGAAIPASRR